MAKCKSRKISSHDSSHIVSIFPSRINVDVFHRAGRFISKMKNEKHIIWMTIRKESSVLMSFIHFKMATLIINVHRKLDTFPVKFSYFLSQHSGTKTDIYFLSHQVNLFKNSNTVLGFSFLCIVGLWIVCSVWYYDGRKVVG